MSDFTPENELERQLVAAEQGSITQPMLMDAFLAGTVVVMLDHAPGDDGELGVAQPLVCRMSDGNDGVAVFTSLERSPANIENFNYRMQTKFSGIVEIIMDGIGLVINPGHLCSFEVPPQGLSELRARAGNQVGSG